MTSFSQTSTDSKWKYNPKMSIIPHFGYAWQGMNTFDAGLRLFTLGGHENFSIMASAIVFQQNVTYVSPELKIRYYKPLQTKTLKAKSRLGLVGLAFSVSYWTSNVLSTREHRITPEISFVLNQRVNFGYGYNIPISTNRLPFISTNRFAIRFIVD